MAVREWITPDVFEEFVRQPENREHNFELITGEIIEVVSSSKSSILAFRMAGYLFRYLQQNDIGEGTSSDGGYLVGNDRYIPDVAFVRHERYAGEDVEGYQPVAPDLAIEVLSPGNDDRMMRRKIVNYLAAGTTVWMFDPDEETIEVNSPGKPVLVLTLEDTLDGGDVLPGFKVAVKDIFRPRRQTSDKKQESED